MKIKGCKMGLNKYPKFTLYEDDLGEWHIKYHKNGSPSSLTRFRKVKIKDLVEVVNE